MKMTWRWYGEGNDQIKLSDIKQIPGVEGIVWALHNKMPGEVWELDEIAEVQQQLKPYGFNMDVVESVNVHDDIKIGLPTRDQYIENYKQTIKNPARFGVKVICYNFMPVLICSIQWGTAPQRCIMKQRKSSRTRRKWRSTSCPSPRNTT